MKNIIAGVTLIFAFYVIVSILSFFVHWQEDYTLRNVQVFAPEKDMLANNLGGKFGGRIALLIITQGFGVSGLLLPIALGLLSLYTLKFRKFKLLRISFILCCSTILISLTLGMLFPRSLAYGAGWGGAHGRYIAQDWLLAIFGKFGSIILMCIAYAMFTHGIISTLYKRGIHFIQQYLFFKKKQIDNNERPSNLSESIPPHNISLDTKKVGDTPASIPFTVEENTPDFKVSSSESQENKHQEEEQFIEQELELILQSNTSQEDRKQYSEVVHNQDPYDPTLDLPRYKYPTVDLLNSYDHNVKSVSKEELETNKDKIVRTLGHYNITISEIKATIGPTITLYEIVPAPGIRISKIKGLENDIALSLAALGIRIIAPIPGKGTIGIEVPNQQPEIVSMRSVIKSPEFNNTKFDLPLVLGKTITNQPFVLDLAKMPHLLIAGATGQGKSVGLNAVLTSLLYKMHPSQLKLVLVDPKKVELPLYSKIEKHFLAKLPDAEEPIITDNQKVIYTVNSLCIEMDARYNLLKEATVRNIKEYNQKFVARRLNPKKGHRYLPYIVLVIDEFADLIMTAGREIEMPIARLAQLARAIGIHLIIATQRPTTNVITGLIKANFPVRVAFRVTSMIDSRTILDTPGAQHLVGKGDMLVATGSDMVRVQCAFVDTPEVERLVDFIGTQQGYPCAFELPEYVPENAESNMESLDLSKRDAMFEQVARLVVETQQGSTSLVQRKFNLGYNRAGRIMDQLEAAGIVGGQEGSKPRQVRTSDLLALEHLLNGL
ncbi:MAG: DNA translocase FtsK 4TM domain-containing protein [Bacteroidales bacterium]